MEILLLCLLGAVSTWAIVDAVKGDDDDPDEAEPALPDDGDTPAPMGLDLRLEEDGEASGTAQSDRFTVANDPNADPEAPAYQFEGRINAQAGNDVISGNFANATLSGGLGDDEISGTFHASEVSGDLGSDRISGSFNDSTVYGGNGGDQVSGTLTESSVYGGAGHDVITAHASESSISGGLGNDRINVSGPGTEVWGDEGDDNITGRSLTESTLRGGEGDDTLRASGSELEIFGDEGDDTIDARGIHASRAYGDSGDDLIILNPTLTPGSNTYAYGGDGDDTLRAYSLHDSDLSYNVLTGGDGADSFEIFSQAPLQTYPSTLPSGGDGTTDIISEITDFEIAHDKLVLALVEIDGVTPDIHLSNLPDGRTSMVELTYLAKSNAPSAGPDPVPHISTIYIHTDGPLTMDHLEILPNTPTVEAAA